MSARLTIVFFILICFEIGFLLIVLPWLSFPSWTENYLLVLAVERLDWHWLGRFLTSGYVRGAVSGLGVVNVLIGIREIVDFKKTLRRFEVDVQGKALAAE
jgi:hypothetical protein